MIFTKYVDGDFVDQFKSTGSIDISDSDLNKNDRLKSKLRSGVSIHSSKRAQILKRIILGDKPIVDGDFVTENNTDTAQFGCLLEKSCYFESSLFTAKWLNECGVVARNDILKQLLSDMPEIKYSPLLPLTAAVLLMYFDSNQTYYLLSHMLRNNVIARTKSEAIADDNALRDLALLRLKSPAVRKHLNQNGTELRWRKWVQHLNLQVLVNFFDCLFMEGPKVKFRFGLAYLNILAKLEMNFIDSYLDQSSQIKLMTKAFGIKNFKWATCSKLINRHKILLDMKQGGLNAEKARLSIADTGEFIDLAEKANSELIKKSHFAQVIAMLPPRFTVQKIQKIFTTKQHGYSLSSVYKNIRGYTDILMLIQTNKTSLLGCFMTSIDSTKNGNSGTGESFLFRVAENTVDSWFWNENNPSIFAVFTKESLTFGNGAIFLDSDLKSCSTSSSETFSNPDLLTNQNTSCPFEVQTLEIFTFIQEELE